MLGQPLRRMVAAMVMQWRGEAKEHATNPSSSKTIDDASNCWCASSRFTARAAVPRSKPWSPCPFPIHRAWVIDWRWDFYRRAICTIRDDGLKRTEQHGIPQHCASRRCAQWVKCSGSASPPVTVRASRLWTHPQNLPSTAAKNPVLQARPSPCDTECDERAQRDHQALYQCSGWSSRGQAHGE